MPYYITKEIINKQIINIFANAHASYDVVNKISDDLVKNSFNIVNDNNEINKLNNLKFLKSDIEEIVDLLFQLKEYKYYLSFLLQMFINTKHYNDICVFFNKIFVNHIGTVSYVSKAYNYEFNERYFDRFVEAIKFCEIDNFKILPFLIEIYFSKNNELIFKWVRPCAEFLKVFIQKNEATYLNYINTEQFYIKGYQIYSDLFPEKGANKIIDNLVSENYFNKEDLYELFLSTKNIGINALKDYIIKSSFDKQKLVLNFYLTFGGDVKTTLPELYEKVTSLELKTLIKDEIDLSKNVKFETIKEFIEFATLNSLEYKENNLNIKYLIYFKNGVKASDEVISYILHLFKNINSSIILKKYKFILDFFNQSELDNLGLNLIGELNGKITDDNKWIVALVSTLCSNNVVNQILPFVPTALSSTDLSFYVLGCLSETKNTLVVNLIKQLYLESNNKQFYFQFLETLAFNAGISALDYLDEMVSNFGLDENGKFKVNCNGETLLFEITENLCVKIKNINTNEYVNIFKSGFSDTNNVLKLYNDLTNEIRIQIGKFKDAFFNKRTWQPKSFLSNILSNPILKTIAKTLVFGEYVQDKFIKLVDFSEIENSEENVKIALVHPIELENNDLKNLYGKFEPFNQINRKIFFATNHDYSLTYCTEFNGIAVSDLTFNANIRTYGYKMNANEEIYYYKPMQHSNLFVKIELIKLQERNVSIIGNIKFYSLNLVQQVNNKFIIDVLQPEQIGTINKRLYSNVLDEISNSI